MRLHLALALFCILPAISVRADEPKPPPSPLRLIPTEAQFVIQAREPQRIAELARKLEVVSRFLALPVVKNQFDSTNARRGAQLLAHFEKKMGDKWPALLEKLAGGGIALGGRYGDNAPVLFVIQGSDEKLAKQFLDLATEVIEGELARAESKDKVEKKSDKGIDGIKVGNNAFLARMGSAIVFSNNKDAIAKAIALHLGTETKSLATSEDVKQASKLLPDKPLIEAWFDLKPAHESPQGKELYKSPRNDSQLTVLFGSYLDIFGRSPFVGVGVAQEKDEYTLTIRAPRGRDGMGPDMALHLPPEGKPGCKPLLEPKGVMYSSSFFFDFAKIWQDRDKLFTPQNAKNLTDADKNAPPFLLGTKVSGILQSLGTQHRIVVTNQEKTGYKRNPKVTIPGFAMVADTRDERKFYRTMDVALRALGLAQSVQLGLELKEETYKDIDIVAYRFDEKGDLANDINDTRFAFSPCYARVGKSFIASSTIELCRDLIDLLQIEEKNPGKSLNYHAFDRYYSKGFGQLLSGFEDQLITQAILDQSVDPAEAKKQVGQFIDFVKGLGDVTSYSDFRAKDWRYDFRFRMK